jgi:adenylate cyclase class 2
LGGLKIFGVLGFSLTEMFLAYNRGMQKEIEAKFLRVDHDVMRDRLRVLGGELTHPMRTMKRTNFDFPDRRMEQKNGWIRVRDEGNKVTLTYKQIESWELHGVKEIETVVGAYDAVCDILTAIGLEPKSYAESKRETWKLDGAEVVLDEWPWVSPFCEVEAGDEATVRAVAAALELDWNDAVFGSVEPVYRAEYDITDPEFYTIADFIFDREQPNLLKERRRKEALSPKDGKVAQ